MKNNKFGKNNTKFVNDLEEEWTCKVCEVFFRIDKKLSKKMDCVMVVWHNYM